MSTDAANKSKTFESDALGNLTKVTEPNPAGGAALETTYTYSELGQLLTVSMPRGGVTQTRTFVYNSTTQRLTSATNPENGTTTNYYNADGTLNYKIDAKNQKISYDYDSLMRVTAVHRFIYQGGQNVEDTTQLTTFAYDANSVAPSFSQNVNGRLAVSKSFAATVTGGVSVTSTFYEMYSYDSAGRVLKKRLRIVNPVLGSVDKDIEYNFTAAKLNTVKYPDVNVPFTYYYDNMLRPNRMTGKDPTDYQDGTNVVDYVNSVNYNVASRMTSMWALGTGTSTYTYNERFELTRQQTGSLADIQYEYSATADNGQILSRTNNIAAEKVAYQYDSLKRLISASATNTSNNATTWASTYAHDGWGNLLSKTPTAGSAPTLSVTVNGLTNRINSGGYTYDANGNMTSSGTFDVDNRLTTASGESYGYLTNNQRVYKRDASGNEWIYFHDASGKRIMTFQMQNSGGTLVLAGGSKNVAFAGRSIILNDSPVVTDRLGSVVSRAGAAVDYFPYGEEKSVTANPAEKFGTYLRDATGLDYADQRYFNSAAGRFISSDPYQASGGPGDPGSWNRNAYVGGDPANFNDPSGLARCQFVSLSQGEAQVYCHSAGGFESTQQWIKVNTTDFKKIEALGVEAIGAELDRLELMNQLTPIAALARRAFDNSHCAALFSGNNVMTPQAALDGMFGRIQFQFGQVVSLFGPPRDAETTTQLIDLRVSFSPIGTYYSRVTIKLDAGIWGVNSTEENLETFIHELGHAIGYLSVGKITGGFVHDDKTGSLSSDNSNMIREKCVNPVRR